jgi:hypothetical protein
MRVAGAVVLFVAGAVTAIAATALHQHWWGLLLGVAATAAALVALGPGWLTRLPFGLGWAGFVAWVAPARAEGDYAISGNAQGIALLATACVVVVVSLATLPRPGRGAPDPSPDAPRMTA